MQQTANAAQKQLGRESIRPLFILAIRNTPDNARRTSINYEFWLSDRKCQSLMAANEKIVSIRRVPRAFAGLSALFDSPDKDLDEICRERQIGYIEYKTSDTLACTSNYEPKQNARWVSSLGYFLESIATYDLRNFGIRMVSTTEAPSEKRVSRLEYVKLPINTPTDIMEWIAGLSRGVRMRIERLHRQARHRLAA